MEEKEMEEREAKLKREYDEIRALENQKIQEQKMHDGEFSETMQSMFVRETDSVQWDKASEQQLEDP